MKNFTPIIDREHPAMLGGWQKVYRFDNGLGLSVIQTPYSYGGSEGLMEIAVLKFKNDTWELIYDTEITDDVIGWLNQDQVDSYLLKVSSLKGDDYGSI
jgi:hypothetical protein